MMLYYLPGWRMVSQPRRRKPAAITKRRATPSGRAPSKAARIARRTKPRLMQKYHAA